MTVSDASHSSHDHAASESSKPVSYGKDVQQELREPATALRQAIPEVYQGFKSLSSAVFADGDVDRKTKELVAFALAVSSQCDGCIASHARSTAQAGATEAEVAEMLGVCILMTGGPGTVYAPRAFVAFREYAND